MSHVVTSWRSDSGNISLVVLDKLLFVLWKPLFKKLQNRGPTDQQHLRIKSPRQRLKSIVMEFIAGRQSCHQVIS